MSRSVLVAAAMLLVLPASQSPAPHPAPPWPGFLGGRAFAQDVQPVARDHVRPPPAKPADEAPRAGRLPADARSSQELALPGRTLRFTAVAGSIALPASGGRPSAEMAYIAYLLDGQPAKSRPVTFAFNGGPGAASTWLHIGAMGPWRLPLTSAMAQPSATPVLLPNAETWLDFTDLVFIDPVGTGYSRVIEADRPPQPTAEDQAKSKRGSGFRSRPDSSAASFWTIRGDVDSLAEFIELWLKRNDRSASPKMLVGESYGGFRAPRIAHELQRSHAVGIGAMVLVSPVIDFDARRGGNLPLYYVHLLPSLAAAAAEREGKSVTRGDLAAVENYARGDYLLDLLHGPRDAAAVDRIVNRVAKLTALPEAAVRRHGGRLSGSAYVRETNGSTGRVASLYDASMTGLAAHPSRPGSRFDDPFTVALVAPMTSAMMELYARFGWRPERRFEMLSSQTNRGWKWGNTPNPPQSVTALQEVLALDRRTRVLVTHGFTDLVTPYFATALQLAQLPAYGSPTRVELRVYPGGHMYYSRDQSRVAFRADAERALRAVLEPPAPTP
ncbi:MAG: S10 family peptidase [Hyphomicrobiaceae bacterium]